VELIPHIEQWINNTVTSATDYTPVEILFGAERHNLFKWLPNLPEEVSKDEKLQENIAKAYERMKQRVFHKSSNRKRRGTRWRPAVNEKVLVRTQPISDAIAGVNGKFMRLSEGPYIISKLIPPSTVELCDSKGRVKGNFQWKSIKVYREANYKA
jgi:hypothetical protein